MRTTEPQESAGVAEKGQEPFPQRPAEFHACGEWFVQSRMPQREVTLAWSAYCILM